MGYWANAVRKKVEETTNTRELQTVGMMRLVLIYWKNNREGGVKINPEMSNLST